MNSTAYKLWGRIKEQMKATESNVGTISLDGSDSEYIAANDLKKFGLVNITSVCRYSLSYECEYWHPENYDNQNDFN